MPQHLGDVRLKLTFGRSHGGNLGKTTPRSGGLGVRPRGGGGGCWVGEPRHLHLGPRNRPPRASDCRRAEGLAAIISRRLRRPTNTTPVALCSSAPNAASTYSQHTRANRMVHSNTRFCIPYSVHQCGHARMPPVRPSALQTPAQSSPRPTSSSSRPRVAPSVSSLEGKTTWPYNRRSIQWLQVSNEVVRGKNETSVCT